MKEEIMELRGKKNIQIGNIKIYDEGKPFTTQITINNKPLELANIITSLTYTVNVDINDSKELGLKAGEARLTIKYYPSTIQKRNKK